jgi:hypothetical protein
MTLSDSDRNEIKRLARHEANELDVATIEPLEKKVAKLEGEKR